MSDHDLLPLVYIAGPYTSDPIANTRRAIQVDDMLTGTGWMVAVVPHLTMLADLVTPHPVEHWYAYDLQILARCDALVRLDGPSTGADAEVLYALERDIPVFAEDFTGLSALYRWARDWKADRP